MSHQMLLDGDWVDRPETMVIDDPETGDEIAQVPMAAVSDVHAAVAGSELAMADSLPGHERARILRDAAQSLEKRAEEAARVIATEGIKTIREARSEAARAVATLRLSAEEAKRATGETLSFDQYPSGVSRLGFSVQEPLGIIGAITPFNDPLNLVAHKVGPALAGGNAVILKPDSKTPLSALFLAGALQEAGLPPGRLQVLTGQGSVVGDAIVTHPAVKMISFTGGVEAGRSIHARAGLKPVSMELGANNAVIVHYDADLELAADRIGSGAFWAAGQNCLHVQRVYAHDQVFEDLVNGLVKYAEATLLGPKMDETTDMGPLIDTGALHRTGDIVTDAQDRGGEILTGGEVSARSFQPTLITDIPAGSRAVTEEIYGPVTVLAPYRELDLAIEAANDTQYELAGAIFTRDIEVAFSAANRLQVGQVMINESTDFRIDAMPFGGGGFSGLGREGVRHAIREMTEPKVIAFSGIEVPGLG